MQGAVDRHATLVADAHAEQRSTHVVPFGATKAPFSRVQECRGDGDVARRSTRRAVELEGDGIGVPFTRGVIPRWSRSCHDVLSWCAVADASTRIGENGA